MPSGEAFAAIPEGDMRMKHLRAGAASLALAAAVPAAPAMAQELPSSPVAAEATGPAVLPRGTEIRFTTVQQLSSRTTKVGDRFDLDVAEDVVLNGVVAIPRKTPAIGEVTLVRKKGMWGKPGRLEAKVVLLRLGGVDVPVNGQVSDRGKRGIKAVAGAAALAPVLVAPLMGFFVTGTSAVVPRGSAATAVLEADLPVAMPAG
jgi:hypothetical protein